jgi:cytochrome c551/c552
MQRHVKAIKFAVLGTVGTASAILLAVSAVQFVAQKAEATPVIAQGKPCNVCHTSSSPSKNDVKK